MTRAERLYTYGFSNEGAHSKQGVYLILLDCERKLWNNKTTKRRAPYKLELEIVYDHGSF